MFEGGRGTTPSLPPSNPHCSCALCDSFFGAMRLRKQSEVAQKLAFKRESVKCPFYFILKYLPFYLAQFYAQKFLNR